MTCNFNSDWQNCKFSFFSGKNRQKVSGNEQKAKERKRAAEAIKVLEAKRVKEKEGVRKEHSDTDREIAELEQSKKDIFITVFLQVFLFENS